MKSNKQYTIIFGYYYRLTIKNICSIIVLVKKTIKEKPILSSGVGAPTQIDFSTHTYKFIVQKGLEFETQQKRHAILLLHINFKLVK